NARHCPSARYRAAYPAWKCPERVLRRRPPPPGSRPRLRQLQQEILRALVRGGDFERRKRLTFRVVALASFEVTLGKVGVRDGGIDGLERDDRSELARRHVEFVPLHRHPPQRRPRIAVERIEGDDTLVNRAKPRGIGDAGLFQERGQMMRGT